MTLKTSLFRDSTCVLVLLFAGVAGVAAKGPAKQAAYQIVPFVSSTLVSTASGVGDLNNVGQAVGWEELADGTTRALHFDLISGAYTTLVGEGRVAASGVNNLNQIVGEDENSGMGLFWDGPGAVPIELPPLPGDVRSWATKINDAGIVIGGSDDDFVNPGVGVVWRVTVGDVGDVHVDGPLPLVPLPGDFVWWGADINELVDGAAQVTGRSSGAQDEAVVWTIRLNSDGKLAPPGPPMGIGSLGRSTPTNSLGSGINELGQVCGRSDKQPFLANANAAPQSLSVPRNTQDGYALGINDLSEIVGSLDVRNAFSAPNWQAFLWRDGTRIELQKQIASDSGWTQLRSAFRINTAGIIAGSGEFDVEHRGFLMIPNR